MDTEGSISREGWGLGAEGWDGIEGDGFAIGGGSGDINGGGSGC